MIVESHTVHLTSELTNNNSQHAECEIVIILNANFVDMK